MPVTVFTILFCLLTVSYRFFDIFVCLNISSENISEDKGKMFFNSLDFDKDGRVIKPTEDGETKYQKPFEVEPENTLLFPRGLGTFGYTTNRRWVDNIKILEDKGFKTIPNIENWNICSSKYYCDQLFRLNGIRTPKTVALSYSDDSERVIKENNLKFPFCQVTFT